MSNSNDLEDITSECTDINAIGLNSNNDSEQHRTNTDQVTVTEEVTTEKNNVDQELDVYNVRPLPKLATTYELEKFEKKILLIFNHENIDGYRPRKGTEKDVEALRKTFKQFGFKIKVYEDKTKKEIFDVLDEFSKRNFTHYGCVGVAVLTHGSKLGLLHSKDDQYSEIEIVQYFQVHDKPTLVTKPKFLIIQACRGYATIPGVPVYSKACKDLDCPVEPYIIPVEADLLILHSSYLGSPSNRDPDCGSWFIQSLCSKINQLASTHDLESIMTEVKRDVAIHGEDEIYNQFSCEMQVNKQMPVMTTTLIRKLYLKKFGDAPCGPVVTVADGNVCDYCNGIEKKDRGLSSIDQSQSCVYASQHFEYVLKIFRYYLEANPEDEEARSYLELSSQFEDSVIFNAARLEVAKHMCGHLKLKAEEWPHYNYLYVYEYQCSNS